MQNTTENLVLAWKERPGRFDPDDTDHLFWVATKLLPALKEAMPAIERLNAESRDPLLAEAKDSVWTGNAVLTPIDAILSSSRTDAPAPSSAEQPAPETAYNIHSLPENLRTVGIGGDSDHTTGSADTPASSPATPPAKFDRSAALARARAAKAAKKAAAAVPPAQPPTTGEVASEDQVPVPPC